MPLFLAVATFLTVLVLLAVFAYYISSPRRTYAERLSRYVELPFAGMHTEPSLAAGQPLPGWRTLARRLGSRFESPEFARSVEHKLIRAGLPLRASEFLVICGGAAALSAVLLLALSGGRPVAALVGAAGGFVIPQLVLRLKAARRIRLFNDQLGDALVLAANSLRTGYSFLQAVEMVAREMPQPIAGEFARTLKEMSLGVTTEQAMNNLAWRVGSDDLDLVVTAVLIQRQVGGNLAEVLDNIAATIRARVKLKGEVRTLTAQGRISGIILCLLPVVIGFATYAINPRYMAILFTHPLGQAMVIGAVVSQVVGVLIIRKIVDINI